MQQIVLIGDSLTQRGYASGWVASLSDTFMRVANVVNGGLSGYNSRWVLEHMRNNGAYVSTIAPPSRGGTILFATIWLGANDAAMEGNYQHVPVAEFESNLKAIVEWTRQELRPQYGILLITPPPCDGGAWAFRSNELYGTPITAISRNVAITREYRDAVLRVGRDTECGGVVDLYAAFGAETPFKEVVPGSLEGAGPWQDCFVDGLHFNAKGDAIARDAIHAAIKDQLKVEVERMPWPVPPHTVYMAPTPSPLEVVHQSPKATTHCKI